jgi:Fe2+ transport system protein FeoA
MTLFGIKISSPPQQNAHPSLRKKRLAVHEGAMTLAQAPPGRWVMVRKYLPGMPAERYAQLRAYGLAPGTHIFVLQQAPITVIRLDHLELALEHSLGREIQVALDGSRGA